MVLRGSVEGGVPQWDDGSVRRRASMLPFPSCYDRATRPFPEVGTILLDFPGLDMSSVGH